MWRIAGTTGSVGLEIAVALAIGYFGGMYLDSKLGSTPWLTWIGFAVGVGAGVKALVRVARSYRRSLEREDEQRRTEEAKEEAKKDETNAGRHQD